MDTRSIYQPRIKFVESIRAAVYDGDSCRPKSFYFDFGWGLKWTPIVGIRLIGIDTPEKAPRKAGRTAESRTLEKKAAKLAREELIRLFEIADYVRFDSANKMDKYGRFLGDFLFYIGDEIVSARERMIELGHAREYWGDKKLDFDDWYNGPAKE